jgi:hypothetical protein
MAPHGGNTYGDAAMSRGARLGAVIAVLVLFLQAAAIAQQHLGPTRYFAWAPNDYIVQYQIRVNVADHDLTAAEIRDRYRYLYATASGPADAKVLSGTFEFPPEQLIDELRQYEETFGRGQHATVKLSYSLNGRPMQLWTYSS